MTLSGESDSDQHVAAMEVFYVVAEFDYQGTYLMTMCFTYYARDERHAAEQAAGVRLGREATPRRILVYRSAPTVFEWRRADNYLMSVGDVIA